MIKPKSNRIAQDIPSFDEAMRKLVQVPKGDIKPAKKTKKKKAA